MVADSQIFSDILSLIPQKHPFRFIDDIISINENEITSSYTFSEEDYFYQGHFPGNPITPGVILIEAMAQSGVVAHGIFHLLQQGWNKKNIKNMKTLFSLADDVAFYNVVKPGQTIRINGKILFFRKNTLRSRVTIHHEDQTLVCHGLLTGSGIY